MEFPSGESKPVNISKQPDGNEGKNKIMSQAETINWDSGCEVPGGHVGLDSGTENAKH